MSKWSPDNQTWLFAVENGDLIFRVRTTGGNIIDVVYDWSTRQVDTWYHVAVTRDVNGTVRMFIGGVQVATQSVNFDLSDSTAPFTVGGLTTGFGLDGFFDQVRVTINNARYTANFIAPLSAFPTSSGNLVEFVGGKTYAQAAGATQTITFDNLGGGIDTVAKSGDVCVIYAVQGRDETDPQNLTLSNNPNGFQIFGPYRANDSSTNSRCVEAIVAVKLLDGPAPTLTTVSAPGSNDAGLIHVMVFRNVASYMFHTPISVNAEANSRRPLPNSVIASRTGTMAVVLGAAGGPSDMPLFDDPLELNYTSKLSSAGSEENHVVSLAGFARNINPGSDFVFSRFVNPNVNFGILEGLSASLAISFTFEPRALAEELPTLPVSNQIRYWFRSDKDVYSDLAGTLPAQDGDRIARWGNQGSEEAAIQSNASFRPTFETQFGNNKLPTIRAFDGFFEDLLEVEQPVGFTSIRPYTAFFVCDRLPVNFTDPNPIFGNAGIANHRAAIVFTNI